MVVFPREVYENFEINGPSTNHHEGSMSEGYLAQESLFYFGEMLTRLNTTGRQIWNEDMMPKPSKVILPKTRTKKKLDCDTHKHVNKHS